MSRSRSRRSNKKEPNSTANPATWDEKLIRFLMPWRIELIGFFLFVSAAVTLLAYSGLTGSAILDPWTRALKQVAGWGIIPLGLSVAFIGLYLMLTKTTLPFQITAGQVIGLELILLAVLAFSHLAIGNGLSGALNGQGGGIVGWALSDPLLDLVGPLLTMLILGVVFVFGAALGFRVSWSDIIEWLNRISLRFQIWSNELEIDIAERRASRAQDTISDNSGAAASHGSPSDGHPAQTELIRIDAASVDGSADQSRREPSLPPLDLLEEGSILAMSAEEIGLKKQIIEQTLLDFGLPAEVSEIRTGPAVTQFGVTPGYIERSGPDGRLKQHKVRVGQIAALQKDLALALAVTRLRIEAPVPGRGIVGIEVPNTDTSTVRLRPVMESETFQELLSPLAVALGLDVTGSTVATDLGKLPHLLIAGTTGSGKSVCLNSLITCLILNNSPDHLKMVMIDPKKVELIRFNGTPHLMGKVEVEGERVLGVLRWLTTEMDRRYELFANAGTKHLQDYNRRAARLQAAGKENIQEMPFIVVVIDELADLMATYPGEVERTLCRLAQMARATGIHLVVATQRPSTDVITGLIKANFPARASFMVASGVDSRVILDSVGAEHLLGKGDMLFLPPDASAPYRIQGCFVSDMEVEVVVGFWQKQTGTAGFEETTAEIPAPWEKMIARKIFVGERDEMLEEAIALAQKVDQISTSLIQRRLRVGYPRAARLMESLHELGLVEDPKEGGKTRRSYVKEGDDPLADILEEGE